MKFVCARISCLQFNPTKAFRLQRTQTEMHVHTTNKRIFGDEKVSLQKSIFCQAFEARTHVMRVCVGSRMSISKLTADVIEEL